MEIMVVRTPKLRKPKIQAQTSLHLEVVIAVTINKTKVALFLRSRLRCALQLRVHRFFDSKLKL